MQTLCSHLVNSVILQNLLHLNLLLALAMTVPECGGRFCKMHDMSSKTE